MLFEKAGNRNDNNNKRMKVEYRFKIKNIKNMQKFNPEKRMKISIKNNIFTI